MTRKRLRNLVRRFFAADPRKAKCYTVRRAGKCVLLACERSQSPDRPGLYVIMARADSWFECAKQILPMRVIGP